MSILPPFTPPDFNQPHLIRARTVMTEPAPADGVVPKNFHGTSNHPEYVHLGGGQWLLAPESRMDAVLVIKGDAIEVTEARRVRKGDAVVVGRTENGEEGIYVHVTGFDPPRRKSGR